MEFETGDNGDKDCWMKLSIKELIEDLRTTFHNVEYDRVEEVLVREESELKAKIKELTSKLELERLERMHFEQELGKETESKTKMKEIVSKLELERLERMSFEEKLEKQTELKAKMKELMSKLELERLERMHFEQELGKETESKTKMKELVSKLELERLERMSFEEKLEKQTELKAKMKELMSNLELERLKRMSIEDELRKQTELKGIIKELIDKLELERLERMSIEDELRKQTELKEMIKELIDKLESERLEKMSVECELRKQTELKGNIKELTTKLDLERLEKISVEFELKAKMKELTHKLALERLERMSIEDKLNKQCEMRKVAEEKYEKLLEVMKKSKDLDDGNAVEFWKNKCDLSKGPTILEKGVNLVMGNDGEAEEPFGLQGNIDAEGSNEVIGKTDMNNVDICDNEFENITAGTQSSLRNDLRPVNTHPPFVEINRHSLDSPNKTVLGKSGPSCSQRKRRRNRSSTSSKQTSAFDYVFQRKSARYRGLFTNLQSSFEEFDPVVSTEADMDQQENEGADIDDHGCGNVATNTFQSQRKTNNFGNAHVLDDNAKQSLDTLNTNVLGASADASRGPQNGVIDIEDSDDDCVMREALNGKEKPRDIATFGYSGHSNVSGIIEPLEAGNSFEGLDKNMVDGSDSDDDSSSSTSSLDSEINDVHLPLNFLSSKNRI